MFSFRRHGITNRSRLGFGGGPTPAPPPAAPPMAAPATLASSTVAANAASQKNAMGAAYGGTLENGGQGVASSTLNMAKQTLGGN